MWESVLTGIILENIETLGPYQTIKGKNSNAIKSIFQFVSNIIINLPWYFRLPVRILASTIGLLCLITTGHRLNLLSSEKRSSFLRRVQFIPFFGMLNKLVRSMAFLKLFDILPAPDCFSRADFERH
jgi:predicted permease